ncbi:retinol dehydrogenase 13 [Cephus cinctus]|uniref:Retinol dehydrogenase 13 n=1 Tax=Cephus cinctus TaxID=211228 RepID=A0AAJ7BMU9_CEPCN|nr:retinol dehydrogenase 13 [Cephus cinctus]
MDQLEDFQKVLQDFSPLLNSYWAYAVGAVLGILTFIRSYMAGPNCPNEERIDGKIVIITGSSSGIGKETALELARRGGHIILAVRNEETGKKVAEEINTMPDGKAEVKYLNLSSLKSVQQFAQKLEINEVDILVNNAGMVFHPYEKTKEGFEMHFVSNYLGHLLLTLLLLPKLKAAKQGRIINVAGQAHAVSSIHLEDMNLEKDYTAREAFGQSKLALILMARHMSQILKETNVTINATNPGLVRGTNHMRRSPISSTYIIKLIMQPWMWLLLKNPAQGAQTTVYAAVTKELEHYSGKYFSDCELKKPSENGTDDIMAEKLYTKSISLVKSFMVLRCTDSTS